MIPEHEIQIEETTPGYSDAERTEEAEQATPDGPRLFLVDDPLEPAPMGVAEYDAATLAATQPIPTDAELAEIPNADPITRTADDVAENYAEDMATVPDDLLPLGDMIARTVQEHDQGEPRAKIDAIDKIAARLEAEGIPEEERQEFWRLFCAQRGIGPDPNRDDAAAAQALQAEREELARYRPPEIVDDPRFQALDEKLNRVLGAVESREIRERINEDSSTMNATHAEFAARFPGNAPSPADVIEVFQVLGLQPGINVSPQGAVAAAMGFMMLQQSRPAAPPPPSVAGGWQGDPRRNPRAAFVIPGSAAPTARPNFDDDPLGG